ncbi:helix-turn-helix domain-containing protein [Streptomyces sp. V3I7]|uniref:helix-turn-helix domain-containing protein n=1 Tax=Streptomyces sp. V3I7 TaxID=3042278 RepID=UPI00277FC807|nr:helix-turn-helix domain-containing protein [Streptomyces sp. V3I7]MDQ0993862.1 transcriptional regulator with XRE-family HTH domain [Streptomyces sp. V3I7]
MDETTLAERVGGRLRQLRKDRALTLAALSRSSGVSVSYLSAVEKGINHPSLHTLAAITEALQVSIPEVLAREGQETIRQARMPERPGESVDISHPLLTLRGVVVSAEPGDHGTCPVDLKARGLFLYVVRGTVVIHVGAGDHTLHTGDALDVTEPGAVTWTSTGASTVVWVSCPVQ